MTKIEKLRKKAKSDLFFFAKSILGYDLMRSLPHKELCEVVCGPEPKKLILLPRGSFKSTVVTISYALWKLVKDPNERIMISSETFNQSKTFLKAIKDHIESNATFRAVFGDLKPSGEGSWRQDEITIVGRTKIAREPSILVSGVGQVRVGLHFSEILLDDVVSTNNCQTSEQTQKIITHYRLLLSILEPGKNLTIIGTRYSFADLYGHLIEEESNSFRIYIKPAILPNGRLLFPTRLTNAYLNDQKRAMGSSLFSNQYMNEVIDQESAIFKQAWMKYFNDPPGNLRHFITIDPASTQEKYSDYTGIVIAGINFSGDMFIIEAIQGKFTVSEMLNIVFDKVMKYDIHEEGCVGIEFTANQQTYKYIFAEEQNKRNFYFPIKELKAATSRSKTSRIKALQPYFENGKIYIRKSACGELIEQILRYPKTRHDDLVDAMSHVLQIMSPSDKEKEDKWDKYKDKLSPAELSIWQQKDELFKPRGVRRTRRRI